MNRRKSFIILLTTGLVLFACVVVQPQVAPTVVPTIIQQTQIVTDVVTEIVTVEVTRIIQRPIAATPAPPHVWRVDVSQGPTMSRRRTLLTATRLNDGRILLVGGSNGANMHYALADMYDPETHSLTPVASLHTARHEHSATLLKDNRVLIVGGYNYQQQWLADAEVYDPSANTWTVVPPVYSHGVQHTATLLLDGGVLVVGGCIGSGVCTNRVEIFEPLTNSWSAVTPLQSARASQAAVLLDDGRVLIAGGGPTEHDARLYDPSANTWTATGPMVQQRQEAQMLKLADGRVLLAGGLDVSAIPIALSSTEIYNPAANAWTAAASLAQPRYAFALEPLSDGQVIALGGAHEFDYPNVQPWTASSFVQQIETYDPQLDLWYPAGTLPQPVTYAAAATLPDGSLWLTGGGAGHAVSTAWRNTWLIAPRTTQP